MAQALIVVAHPDPTSLTHAIAHRVAAMLPPGAVELADLAAEGFRPQYTLGDRRAYQGAAGLPSDVLREQARLDRATDLVLVFPVHWWSMPALLKGWIDRVFVDGWAFHLADTGRLRPGLERLTTHVIAVAGDDAAAYDRRGYRDALLTQLAHGVLDYCGSPRGAFEIVHESEDSGAARLRDRVEIAAQAVRDRVGQTGR